MPLPSELKTVPPTAIYHDVLGDWIVVAEEHDPGYVWLVPLPLGHRQVMSLAEAAERLS